MKWIEYQVLCNKDKNIFIDKKIEHTEANLAIAKSEAYNGQYYITEDEKTFEKKPVEIELGGTNAKTAEAALINLGAVSKTEFNQLGNTVSEIDKEQKATTRLVEYLHRMEHGVKYVFEDDSEIGYAKDVPSGAKMASLKMIGGMTRKCTNLIPYPYVDTTKTVNGITFTDNGDGTITANGTATGTADFMLSNALDVKKGNIISGVQSGGATTTFEIQVYLNAGNYISTNAGLTIATTDFISPARVRIRSGYTANNLVFKPMLNEGSTALPYEPYFEGLRSAPVKELKSEGANLIPFPYYAGGAGETVTLNGITYVINNDASITINGTSTALSSLDLWINPTIFSVGDTFTITGKSGDVNVAVLFAGIAWGNDTFTITEEMLTNSTSINVQLRIPRGVTISNVTVYPMLNRGSTVLPYRPFKAPITRLIPAEIQAVDGYGEGINDTCYNYVDWENKQFVKRVGKVDMGTLDWTYYGGKFFMVLNDKKAGFGNLLCGLYSTSGVWWENTPNRTTTGDNSSNYVFVNDSNYTDATSFKSAMVGVMLYYELATPEIIDISDILTDDGFIDVEGHGTLTFVNEHEIAVPNEEEYLIDLLEVVS